MTTTPKTVALAAAVALLAVYLATLAPGVTFWDAGEFIAASYGLGIPHPPGVPLYVSLGRSWLVASGWLLGAARASNALSAMLTASAGATLAWLMASERDGAAGRWGALTAALVAGLATSVWAVATETEVYAFALAHAALLLAAAARAGERGNPRAILL
nr:DUF2723 domain-containing protein [Gemmatimonadaceae bacterium]